MTARVLFALVLVTFACVSGAVDAPLPCAFVNGSAKGYSIKME
jgi:hypothetical protein